MSEKTNISFIVPPWVNGEPKICGAMSRIMKKVEHVAKDRRNAFHKYDFRGIDDVLNMMHDILSAEGVWVSQRHLEREETIKKTKNDGENVHVVLTVELLFTAEDGSQAVMGPIYGEGMDTGDKATHKAASMAEKIAYLHGFAIPTKEGVRDDNDTQSPEVADQPQGNQPQASSATTPALIGPELAITIYGAYGEFGITQDQLHRKLHCGNIADLPREAVGQLKQWKDAIAEDRRNITKIFGGQSPTSRANALNARRGA